MRIGGLLLVVVLVAAAVLFYLHGKSAQEDLHAVSSISTKLREGGVEAHALDPAEARSFVRRLESMIAAPDTIEDSRDALRMIAARAASWAAAAPSPSPELHAAVALRSAADELRTYGVRGGEGRLDEARRQVEAARRALSGEAPVERPTDALRDRLQNLQRGQQERLRQLDEAMQQ